MIFGFSFTVVGIIFLILTIITWDELFPSETKIKKEKEEAKKLEEQLRKKGAYKRDKKRRILVRDLLSILDNIPTKQNGMNSFYQELYRHSSEYNPHDARYCKCPHPTYAVEYSTCSS